MMRIEQRFHDYCEGCQMLDVVHKSNTLYITCGAPAIEDIYITCENYQLCARLWDRLSTIKHEPPDLMRKIAAICQKKGISVDEAVELFDRL